MELGGAVTIECEKTGYRVDLEFKLKVHQIVNRNLLYIFIMFSAKSEINISTFYDLYIFWYSMWYSCLLTSGSWYSMWYSCLLASWFWYSMCYTCLVTDLLA